ncbi:MAG: hypothetical protein KTR32_13225 [Granulosicoccus sp.]|nr:hypothetical protein [Granulosicoccus sp.]
MRDLIGKQITRIRCAAALTALSVLLIQGCSESDDQGFQNPVDFVQGTWVSECYGRSVGGSYEHVIRYEGFDFTIDSVLYRSSQCDGRPSRTSQNWMQGKFLPGETFISADGLEVMEVDYLYNGSDVESREFFDPAPFEIAYLNQSSGEINIGRKSRRGQDGMTWRTRPQSIDFSNIWTKVNSQ